MLVEGSHVACQTWIEGMFVRDFTQSPAASCGRTHRLGIHLGPMRIKRTMGGD